VVGAAGLGASGVDRAGSRLEQGAGLTALVALTGREGGHAAAVGIQSFDRLVQGLRGKTHLDVVRRVQDLVGLDIHRHVATCGATLAAGDRGTGLGGGVRVGPVKFLGSPAKRSHQLVRCAHTSQAGRQLGNGAFEEIVAVVGVEAGGHEGREPAPDSGE
jgi:hypothetical protein